MFFYLTYNFVTFPDNVHKTSTTFFIGAMMWWFLASLLWSPTLATFVESNFITSGMKQFFQWLIIIDIVTLALQLEVLKEPIVEQPKEKITQPEDAN